MTEQADFEVPGCDCPGCGIELNGATSVGAATPAAPKDGDLTVCAYCGIPLKYAGAAVCEMSEQEWRALDDELKEAVCRLQAAIFHSRGRSKGNACA